MESCAAVLFLYGAFWIHKLFTALHWATTLILLLINVLERHKTLVMENRTVGNKAKPGKVIKTIRPPQSSQYRHCNQVEGDCHGDVSIVMSKL